jgi:hypothetical protein
MGEPRRQSASKRRATSVPERAENRGHQRSATGTTKSLTAHALDVLRDNPGVRILGPDRASDLDTRGWAPCLKRPSRSHAGITPPNSATIPDLTKYY